jgi:flagellar basal-body rod protein FlgC
MVDFETAPTQSPFDQAMQSALDREMQGVKVSGIVNDPRPLRKVYEPGHPNADQDGYVSYPNVNVVQEMANMMTATRSYEANVTSISTAKAMFDKALELSR